jgi:cytochrome c5
MINNFKYKYLFFLLIFICACTSSKNTDTKKDVANPELILAKERVPEITMEQLKHGGRLYTRNCSACHALHKPSQYTASQWHPILVKMFEKSKIRDSATKTLITNYLVAKSK